MLFEHICYCVAEDFYCIFIKDTSLYLSSLVMSLSVLYWDNVGCTEWVCKKILLFYFLAQFSIVHCSLNVWWNASVVHLILYLSLMREILLVLDSHYSFMICLHFLLFCVCDLVWITVKAGCFEQFSNNLKHITYETYIITV